MLFAFWHFAHGYNSNKKGEAFLDKLYVIIPAYNESENLETLVDDRCPVIKEWSPFDRRTYFDYLRMFAASAVMMLHIAAKNWYVTDVNGFEWQVFNFYDHQKIHGIII